MVGPFAALAAAAASISHGEPVLVEPAYHLDLRPEWVMALTALAVGAVALGMSRARESVVRAISRLGDLAGPRRWYGLILNALHVVSHRLHDAEVRDLRTSLAAVILPTGLLIALAIIVTPTVEGTYAVGSFTPEDLPIVVLLGLAVVAAFTVARDRGRLRAVLALSVLGFALAAVYAVVRAPDVALVAVLIETMLTIVFVARLLASARRRSWIPDWSASRPSAIDGTWALACLPASARSPRCGPPCRVRRRVSATLPSRSPVPRRHMAATS